MNAILGKITKIKKLRGRGRSTGRQNRLEVSFKAACVMPGRAKPPEWLKDQVLKVTRVVPDPRELGGVGDSIVLTPGESAEWLFPLAVHPDVVYGRLPTRLKLTLRWWKNKKPGEFTVCANGRRKTGKFVKSGKAFSASVPTRDFFDRDPSLPAEFTVTFDKLTVACTVLPAEGPCHCKLRTVYGDRHRVENAWYAIDVCAGEAGGGISALREKGRGVDHFRTDDDLIHGTFDRSGHIDSVRFGWSEKLSDIAMSSANARHEDQTTRLHLEGVLDKGRNIHTTAAYTLFHRLPLISLNRDVLFHKEDKTSDSKDGKSNAEKPTEPIDKMTPVSLGFRAAYLVETNARSGSRVLSVDGDRFAVLRYTQMPEMRSNGWRLADGWVIMEHPVRRECMMYMFDRQNTPLLRASLVSGMTAMQPIWLPLPVKPESGRGVALAICAGELCGADTAGAWVACRRPSSDGGVECAVVGRFRASEDISARIQIGSHSLSVPMKHQFLPGVGDIRAAAVVIPAGTMNSKFDITAGDVPARRIK